MRSGKVEIGQGILSALAQVVAEELVIDRKRVRMVPACTAASPDEGMTSGSLSIQDSAAALRQVCAEARAIYQSEAAAQLGVAADLLALRDGEFSSASRRTSYWELADDRLLATEARGDVSPLPRMACASDAAVARIDLPDKVRGRPRFIHDLQLPLLAHGRVLRPPSPAARLAAFEEQATRAIPGVLAVVRDGNFVGVVAEREEIALAALERLRRDARWDETETLPDAADLPAWLRSRPHETTVIAERGAMPAKPERTMQARFSRPLIAHASLAPSCALARWDGDRLRVWSHTQGVFNLRADLAKAFARPETDVVVEHREGAGCYGHNGADDVALDAALLARATAGRPVRVVWSREDELAWAPFGSAMAVDLEIDLDHEGEILAWRSDVWSNGHSLRPGRAATPTLLAATHLENAFPRLVAINMPIATGGGSDRNAVPAYAIPTLQVRNHRVLDMPLRTSALRSLGAFANVFAIESAIDEIARARGEDPVAWRLRHLEDARARSVIEAAAARPPWANRTRREAVGQGFAYAQYKGNGAHCAVTAEVELTHTVRVTRLCVAADVGYIVSRDGTANQLEGGAVQATSWALKEAVGFDRTRVTSTGWDTYPILRFSEVPEVEVVLVESSSPSVGAGEAAQGPVAAAIANAVFDAIGARVRDLPITADRVAAALGE